MAATNLSNRMFNRVSQQVYSHFHSKILSHHWKIMTTQRSNLSNNPISSQVEKLRQVVLQRDTIESFQQSIGLLFTVLRETALLLWLVLCFSIVALTWLGEKAITSGRSLKIGLTELQENSRGQDPGELLSNTSRSVLLTSRSAASYLVTQAKQQVGLSDD
jgi:hypothetical protein